MDPSDCARHPETAPPLGAVAVRMALRLAGIVLVALLAMWLIDWSMALTEHLPDTDQRSFRAALIGSLLLIYVLLMALPFVPGIEIGLSLLMLRGAEIAPAVYGATVLGLALAWLVGRQVPILRLRTLFLDLRLRRAADLLTGIAPLSPAERLARIDARLPGWARRAGGLRWRYLALALLLNMPGNVILGGGGGICLLAGLSGLFRPGPMLVTLALAVAPLPLVLWLAGYAGMPGWLPY